MIGLTSPRDAWLALQFDQAISLLGRYLDGKLSTFDDQGRPKHTLEGLLADSVPRGQPGPRKRYASPGRKRDW